jgi:hypothetical protein
MKAFPTYHYQRDESGMDLRDYFASKAMQGDIASYTKQREWEVEHWACEAIAERSYRMADAMMKARKQ